MAFLIKIKETIEYNTITIRFKHFEIGRKMSIICNLKLRHEVARVLIEAEQNILGDFLRFIKALVDGEIQYL